MHTDMTWPVITYHVTSVPTMNKHSHGIAIWSRPDKIPDACSSPAVLKSVKGVAKPACIIDMPA